MHMRIRARETSSKSSMEKTVPTWPSIQIHFNTSHTENVIKPHHVGNAKTNARDKRTRACHYRQVSGRPNGAADVSGSTSFGPQYKVTDNHTATIVWAARNEQRHNESKPRGTAQSNTTSYAHTNTILTQSHNTSN